MSRSTFGLLGLLGLAATACVPRQSGDQSEVTPGTTDAAALGEPQCSAGSDSMIATLEPSAAVRDEAPCGVMLELDGGELSLRPIPPLGAGEGVATAAFTQIAAGPAPEACGEALARCELWGVHDALGPVLLASVRGPESEVPEQVYVGWVVDRRLVFAPSWYGLSSVADHTRVGPPWALAPHDCAGELALLPVARLPEAAVEQPDPAVLAAAGRWTVGEAGEAVRSGPALDAAGCRPLFAAVP